MLDDSIRKLINQESLTQLEASNAFSELFKDGVDKDKIASFLLNLEEKGYTLDEIIGCGQGFLQNIKILKSLRTGLVNLSTLEIENSGIFAINIAAAFVVAGAGIPVAANYLNPTYKKSKDLLTLQGLGIYLKLTPEECERCLNDIGIVFVDLNNFLLSGRENLENTLFSLKTRTIFDILNVILSPFAVKYQLVGNTNIERPEMIVKAATALNINRLMFVRGEDNLDAITIADRTKITDNNNGELSSYFISPEDFGLKMKNSSLLSEGSLEENSETIKNILENKGGEKTELVLLNAAAAIFIADGAKTWKDALEKAVKSLKYGRALSKYKNTVNWTNNCKKE